MSNDMDKKLQERLKALSPEKRELLLKKLREQKKGESSEDTHINLLPRDTNVFPLSFAQERLWFFTQLEPESPLYNLPVAIKFTGELKVDILQKVFERLVERHEILRTTFEVRGKKQVQVIQEPYTWDMPVENFDHLSSDEQHKVIINKVSEEVLKLFDLGSLPLMRTRLLSFSEKEHVLILVSHHIVSDGWSFSVMINEMNNLYNALCNNTEVNISSLDIHYADYSVWQKETLQGEKVEELISFWRKQLEDVPVLSLPVDNPRPPIQTYNGKRYNFNIEKDITENIKTFSKDHGVTLFMTLFSIYAILIQKYSRQKDFAIGSPIANRNNAQVEPLIGFFVNMLALRCDLEGDPTFIELLNKIKKTTLDAYSHQDLPFEKLVDELVTTRDMSRSPLFQVAFVLQTAHSETFNFEGLTAEKIPVGNDASGFDMTMEFYEIDDALHGAVEYNADLFDEVTIKAFATYYNRLIDMVCDRPEERISAYSLLSPEEYALITQQWNETDRLFPSKTVVELFEEQVVKNPTQTAVIWQDESLTYDELNRRANKLAHFLQKQGAAPGTLVGLCVERSIELFVGLIGIIKSGAAYVPMDPEYPEDRLEYMIADEDVKALLTEESLKEKILNKSVPTFLLDKEWGTIDAEVDKNCASAITPDDLIYVIYTSGSTGKPKGVEVFHKSVVNICSWHQALCKIDESTKMTQMAGIGFDATGLEYWPYLTGGAILFPVPKDTILNPPELMKFYTEHGITHSFAATPIAEKIFLEPVPEKCTLTYLLTGGEKLNGRPPVHVPYTVIDHYGPAEATITTTFCVVPSEGENVTATVGRPLDNMKVFILDESLAPVPMGVPGEIYISGVGISRGYHNQPELTAERFIENPIQEDPYRILYKTGDVGRFTKNGKVQFIGRTDFQVKIRGYRIELGEIEAILLEYGAIKEGVAVTVDDPRGEKRLVAYVVPNNDDLDEKDVRNYLKSKLPDYMVPQAYVTLSELPLTANGKVNRRALPPVGDIFQSNTEYIAPRDAVEKDLAAIWCEVLNLEQVGVSDDFFDLGGHSLLATQVISRVQEMLSVEISVRSIFEHTVLSELAEYIKHKQGEESSSVQPLIAVDHSGEWELSFAQSRLWFLEQLHKLEGVYTIVSALKFSGPLDLSVLSQVFETIISRHESLRTTFFNNKGVPYQKVNDNIDYTLKQVDAKSIDWNDQSGVKELVNNEITIPFDLEMGPLFRTTNFSFENNINLLIISMHHIISDGWSMEILMKELITLYDAYKHEKESPLSPIPISYIDYTAWQKKLGPQLDKQLEYWKHDLAALKDLKLPFDYKRPETQSFTGGRKKYSFQKELTLLLKSLSNEQNTTLFMTLLSVFNTLLYHYTGQTDIALGTPIANRNKKELEQVIGFFANTLVLRSHVKPQQTFVEFLQHVKDKTLQAYENQDVPFDTLVDEISPDRDISSNPLFQSVFAVQNLELHDRKIDDVTISILDDFDIDKVRFDLEVHAFDTGEEILFYFIYNSDLFKSSTVDLLATRLENISLDILQNPQKKISEYSMLSESEKEEMLQNNQQDKKNPSQPEDIDNIENMDEEDIDAMLDSL